MKNGKDRPKVIVLGGGVAGLSAAHELMERGFEVSVYEAKSILGGKARSMTVEGSGTKGRKDLPSEHGFRFFPKFYKHVTDTMKRIPYNYNKRGVFDNLIEGTNLGLAFFDRPMLPFVTEFPTTIHDWKMLLTSLFDNDLGLSKQDVEHYVERLWQMMTSSDIRRLLDYQRISWWDYIEADKQSEQFRQVFAGLSRILVAAKAKEANACTIGTVGATLMLDMVTPGGSADRLLDGPTNDVWIEPWHRHLTANGVEIYNEARVTSIHMKDGEVAGVTVERSGQTELIRGDCYIFALPVEVMAKLVNQDMIHADPLLGQLIPLSESVEWMNGVQFYLSEDVPLIHGHIICMDSPWALTLISQQQFWNNYPLSEYGDGSVRGVISVDVSDWEAPGILYNKPAMNCTREEIREEVWEQLKRSFNQAGKEVLRDEMVVEWYLDEDIHFPNPHESVNMEPLLVNRVHTWDMRPNAYTRIPNLYLASDYVRTNTDLATMEGANEAARRAVNAILEHYKIDEPPCKIWDMYDFDLLKAWRANDENRYERGLPWNGKIVG
ncbi:hydroxysqualene dehydroxylase [Paenibacillus sp. 1001270B_150601_E10]|uniref:hydroxysqualene dehydroxylase n=1 Tax=Paenibacillus sp. 1001270B_150601_E10 TaxID=2787079 RepID=UPI00189FCEB8|nr:FAD-dependent oxidoreductase [Paenibacillus sp. 1001270B_150601_E10]